MKNIQQVKTELRERQAPSSADAELKGPYHIDASTRFDFRGQHLTAFGGLLAVATMLEKLGFPELVAEHIRAKRDTRVMTSCQFVLAIVLSMYLGFRRFHQFRFIAADPMLNGVLHTPKLPPQCTFWRFLASLHISAAGCLLRLQQQLRARVWEVAGVRLRQVTLDTDTTVHTVCGRQMGAKVSHAPKKKGARSYQPILTFLAETREYVTGQLRNGNRPSAKQIQAHLRQVMTSLPAGVEQIRARADSGFHCQNQKWRRSRHQGAEECDFSYQPEGWAQPCRFIALRFAKPRSRSAEAPEQYQLFETEAYLYRVFVTNMKGPVPRLVAFYNGRCAAENLIKEANYDAGIIAHPFYRFDMNRNHFQLAMLAYNLNCWLALFSRPESVPIAALRHTTLATARLRFLFIAARLWRHAGRIGVSFSDSCPDKVTLTTLMRRLRQIPAPAGVST